MADFVRAPLKYILAAGLVWPTSAALSQSAPGEMIRPPDLGVWLSPQRDPSGRISLIVSDLLSPSALAQAGLQPGDRLISINGRALDREQQFVEGFLTNPTITLVITRDNRQQVLTMKSSTVMEGLIPLDPFYQAGFLIDENNTESITIERVFPATPAFYAGLKPGDVISVLNEQPLASSTDLTKALRRGGSLRLTVKRDGQIRQFMLIVRSPTTRRSILTDVLSSGSIPPTSQPSAAPPPAPILAPPPAFNPLPAIPSPPPALPVLPPPGAVPNRT